MIRLTFRSLAAFCDVVSSAQRPRASRPWYGAGRSGAGSSRARRARAVAPWMGKVTHSCQLQDFGSQVLENSCDVYGSLGADAHLVLRVLLQETLDTTTGELRTTWSATWPSGIDGNMDEEGAFRRLGVGLPRHVRTDVAGPDAGAGEGTRNHECDLVVGWGGQIRRRNATEQQRGLGAGRRWVW